MYNDQQSLPLCVEFYVVKNMSEQKCLNTINPITKVNKINYHNFEYILDTN